MLLCYDQRKGESFDYLKENIVAWKKASPLTKFIFVAINLREGEQHALLSGFRGVGIEASVGDPCRK